MLVCRDWFHCAAYTANEVPTPSLASARLTRSEIDSLRQGKKQIADYAQKAFQDKISKVLGLPGRG